MPEPDFSGLRAHVESVTKQPEFAAVEGRSARLRRRTRLLAATAAVATIVLVGTATIGVAGVLRDAGWVSPPQASPPSTTPPPPSPTPSAEPDPEGPGSSAVTVDVAAGDTDHLYVIAKSCTRMPGCPAQLTVGERGANGWQWHTEQLPGGQAGLGIGLLQAFGTRALFLATPGAGVKSAGAGAASWTFHTSVDAGRTWSVNDIAGRTLAEVPPGGQLLSWGEGGNRAVLAGDPRTGRVGRLANQPPVTDATVGYGSPVDAGIWVSGYDRSTGQAAVTVSRDRGRSWQTSVVPELPGSTGQDDGKGMVLGYPATYDGRTAYLAATTNGEGAAGNPLYRTDDGGRTWQRVAYRHPQPRWMDGYRNLVLADGTYLTVTNHIFYASRDRGMTFEQVRLPGLPAGYTGDLRRIPGGYLATRNGWYLYQSADGWSWQVLQVPAVP